MLTNVEKIALEALRLEADSNYENIAEASGLSVAVLDSIRIDLETRALW